MAAERGSPQVPSRRVPVEIMLSAVSRIRKLPFPPLSVNVLTDLDNLAPNNGVCCDACEQCG
jgi:hypothetical protein